MRIAEESRIARLTHLLVHDIHNASVQLYHRGLPASRHRACLNCRPKPKTTEPFQIPSLTLRCLATLELDSPTLALSPVTCTDVCVRVFMGNVYSKDRVFTCSHKEKLLLSQE